MIKHLLYRIFFKKQKVQISSASLPNALYLTYVTEFTCFGVFITLSVIGISFLLIFAICKDLSLLYLLLGPVIYFTFLILIYHLEIDEKFQKFINLENIYMAKLDFFYHFLFKNYNEHNIHDPKNVDNVPFHIKLKDGSEHYGFFYLYTIYNSDLTHITYMPVRIETFDPFSKTLRKILFFEQSKDFIRLWQRHTMLNALYRWKNKNFILDYPEHIINPNDIVYIKPMANISWWALIDDYIRFC